MPELDIRCWDAWFVFCLNDVFVETTLTLLVGRLNLESLWRSFLPQKQEVKFYVPSLTCQKEWGLCTQHKVIYYWDGPIRIDAFVPLSITTTCFLLQYAQPNSFKSKFIWNSARACLNGFSHKCPFAPLKTNQVTEPQTTLSVFISNKLLEDPQPKVGFKCF